MYYGVAEKNDCHQASTYVWETTGAQRWYPSRLSAMKAFKKYSEENGGPDELKLSNFCVVKSPNKLVLSQSVPQHLDTTVNGRVEYTSWGLLTPMPPLKAEAEAEADYYVPFEKSPVKDTADASLF